MHLKVAVVSYSKKIIQWELMNKAGIPFEMYSVIRTIKNNDINTCWYRGLTDLGMWDSKRYLWAVLWSPHLWFCEEGAPGLGCPHSSSARSCYHHWLCRRPSSSEHRMRYGAHHSSGDPTGLPVAGCLPVFVSAASSTTKQTTTTADFLPDHLSI